MGISRTRTLVLLCCVALAALSLRPIEVVERTLEIALAPAAVLGELAAPLAWLQRREVRAAESRRAEAAAELELHHELELAVLRSAWPLDEALLADVHPVHAEVIGRPDDDLDTIRIRVADPGAMREGLPVVSGSSFVGLVERVPYLDDPSAPPVVEVRLITARKGRIGGRVAPGPGARAGAPDSSQMVVGSLAPRSDVLHLDVHNPSDRGVDSGLVTVYEPMQLAEGYSHLANGFVLGDLVHEDVYPLGRDGVPIRVDGLARLVLGIRPRLDFETGLFQVLVLAPRGDHAPPPPRVDVLEDGGWAPARVLVQGEPSPWREGRKLDLGRRSGVVDGSAIASGVRLVGRVQRAGPWTSNVVLMGDRGFSVPAIALYRQDGEWRTHVLGRLRSAGRERDGAVLFRWPATVPLAGEGQLEVQVWSGSGERGMPRGLLIGAATLERGGGSQEIRVVPPGGASERGGLVVRLGEDWRHGAEKTAARKAAQRATRQQAGGGSDG